MHGNENAKFPGGETSAGHKRLRILHVGRTVAHARGLCRYDVPWSYHKGIYHPYRIVGTTQDQGGGVRSAGCCTQRSLGRVPDAVRTIGECYTGIWAGWVAVRINESMLECEAFDSIPSSLEIGRRNYPVIVTGRKPTCSKCSRMGHLTLSFSDKKAQGVPPKTNYNPTWTCSATTAARTGGQISTVGSPSES